VSSVAVVTGAGGAMGTACALELVPAVDVVLLTDLDESRLGVTASRVEEQGVKVETVAGDIADVGLVRRIAAVAADLGGLRALVHTAGLSPAMAEWREILRVDLAAVSLLLDTFLPTVLPGSVAVCVASIAGHLGIFDPSMDALCDEPLAEDFEQRFLALFGETPDPGSTYRLAKRGTIRTCERAAVTWGERGGRVVSLSPGLIDTDMGRLELEHNEVKNWMAEITPVGGDRLGTEVVLPGRTEDIARAVAFLCSDRAAFISGCDIRVDGGLVAAMQHQPVT
jgi:NAD(P)-dependent dehydrogenase (short-subunit alcohol dehydrogenase family)